MPVQGWTDVGNVVGSGHSLGAALSLLFAAELHSRHSELAKRVAGVYAFASPRVGDAAFAAAFNKAFCNPDRLATSLLNCVGYCRSMAMKPHLLTG